jgi:hypothetical protein
MDEWKAKGYEVVRPGQPGEAKPEKKRDQR